MPVKVTPEEFQEKHARRLKAALEDIRTGVAKVTEAPGQKAAAKADKWHERITAPETRRKWERRVAAVPLEERKKKMIDSGVGRIPAGIDGAKDKVIDFATKLIAYENTVLTEIEKMPDITLEDSIARASHWIRRLAEFEY